MWIHVYWQGRLEPTHQRSSLRGPQSEMHALRQVFLPPSWPSLSYQNRPSDGQVFLLFKVQQSILIRYHIFLIFVLKCQKIVTQKNYFRLFFEWLVEWEWFIFQASSFGCTSQPSTWTWSLSGARSATHPSQSLQTCVTISAPGIIHCQIIFYFCVCHIRPTT